MRDILSKVVTGSMIAGAALLVSACGDGGTNNAATSNMDSGGVYNADMPTDINNLGTGNVDMGNTSAAGNTSTTTTGTAGNTSVTTTTTTNTTTAGNNQ